MGSQWALEQAKYNLVNEYMLVGVTEELEDFVMMLEAALPRFFKGATELYKTGAAPATQFKQYIYLLRLLISALNCSPENSAVIKMQSCCFADVVTD